MIEERSVNISSRVAVGLISALVTVGLFVAPISPAQGLCWDEDSPYGYTWGIHGTEWHRYPSTCNDDG